MWYVVGTGCTSDIAFDKEQLTEQITEFGGQIIDDFSEVCTRY